METDTETDTETDMEMDTESELEYFCQISIMRYTQLL